ncbi:MAG: hypothetical protein LBG15_12635 [Dysgonamonadaceae bacterium]|nr:hypothetical protein [Dysgonamonadaceae bacterium]
MKSKEEQINELKRLIRDYETIISIHTELEPLNTRKDYVDYIDSILDEISIIKQKIEDLEKQ